MIVAPNPVLWAFDAQCDTNQYRLGYAVIQSDGTPDVFIPQRSLTLGEGVDFDDAVTGTCREDPVYFNRLSGDMYNPGATISYRISYDSALSGTQERFVYISPSGLIW